MTKKQYYIRDRHMAILVDTIRLDNGILWLENKDNIISHILNKFYKLKYHFTSPDGTIHFKIVER